MQVKDCFLGSMQAVVDMYDGTTFRDDSNLLFPDVQQGCFNFGLWDVIPDEIDLDLRIQSQLKLYSHIFDLSKVWDARNSLEIACGRGHSVAILTNQHINAFGCDINQNQIFKCIRNYPSIANRFFCSPADEISKPNNSFDVIYSLEAAQHFPSFFSFCREAFRLLRVGGCFAVSTYFYTASGSDRSEISKYIPMGPEGLDNAISIHLALFYLEQAGFSNIMITPIGDKVFEGFSKWALQCKPSTPHTKNWVYAYKKNWIDYYTIIGYKL